MRYRPHGPALSRPVIVYTKSQIPSVPDIVSLWHIHSSVKALLRSGLYNAGVGPSNTDYEHNLSYHVSYARCQHCYTRYVYCTSWNFSTGTEHALARWSPDYAVGFWLRDFNCSVSPDKCDLAVYNSVNLTYYQMPQRPVRDPGTPAEWYDP